MLEVKPASEHFCRGFLFKFFLCDHVSEYHLCRCIDMIIIEKNLKFILCSGLTAIMLYILILSTANDYSAMLSVTDVCLLSSTASQGLPLMISLAAPMTLRQNISITQRE